jgi:NAD(P)-dependent dehydrogenase (short-subunit alcohol dehydrogenase family)
MGMANSDIADRAVLVFGAGGALGAGIARAFADAGAMVTGADKVAPPASRRIEDVKYEAVDVLDDREVGALIGAGEAPWAVVNTIGGYAPGRPLSELDSRELMSQLELNLVTAALITKHALQVMQDAGQGRIVHTASRAGVVTKGNGFAYSVSKAGVLHLVAMAADEVRGTGVTVNCVVPSIIDTPANRAALPDADFGKWPKVEDIASSYVYLAGPDAHLVNGAALPV